MLTQSTVDRFWWSEDRKVLSTYGKLLSTQPSKKLIKAVVCILCLDVCGLQVAACMYL